MEKWKSVPGFEELYSVSDHGRVFSLRKKKVLRPNKSRDGRLSVMLYGAGKPLRRVIASLVMLAFIGPRDPDKMVCHWDGDCTNNVLSNLRYDTASGNMADRKRLGERIDDGDAVEL